MAEATVREQENDLVFALDIGTRSIIGIVGQVEEDKLHVLAIESASHGQRAMMDGQIENIGQVAGVAQEVIDGLERRLKVRLKRVCVAAAGRALRSESASFALEFPETQPITDENISELEAGAVSEAEKAVTEQSVRPGRRSGGKGDKASRNTGMSAAAKSAVPAKSAAKAPVASAMPGHMTTTSSRGREEQYYMVGYTVTGYRIDGYPMSSIRDHSGKVIEAEVVATFLPRGVVDSLYAVVAKLGLEVASLTLEPIAALNAAIPSDIRLLNLVLVDIGAGTSDIAICRDGSVVGYTMATVAGDEVTELFMRSLLVDFDTGEMLKMALDQDENIPYTDILGMSHEAKTAELRELAAPAITTLAKEIAQRVMDLNGRLPSAVFLAGGGCKLFGLREKVAEELKIDPNRVTTAGNHFQRSAFSEDYNLNDPEYATPLGIAISSGLGLINDSYVILLNNEPAKLFRSGALPLRDILMMNGYGYSAMLGRTGANLSFTFNGERKLIRGALAVPPVLLINGELASITDTVSAGDNITFQPARNGADASRTLRDLLGDSFTGTVTVNGAEAQLDDPIHTGDDIWATGTDPDTDTFSASGFPVSASGFPGGTAPAANSGTAAGSAELRVTLNGESIILFGKPNGEPYILADLLKYSGLDFEHPNTAPELIVNDEPGQFSQVIREGDNVIIR